MRTVFFDVDTQLDFLAPAGALAAPGAEAIAPALATLTQFAGANGIAIISTVDTHPENDPEFEVWKPHCVAGTQGHQKFAPTLLKNAQAIGTDPISPETIATLGAAEQFLVHKHSVEPFSNPNLTPLLDRLGADDFVVYGLVTEVCVRLSAVGLLGRNAKVRIVTDAIRGLADAAAREALLELERKGAELVTFRHVVI